MTGVFRRLAVWLFHYVVPAALMVSWLVVTGYAAHWDMPMRRCNGPTGYCDKSGAPKAAIDYRNSQKMDGIIVVVWLIAGIGGFASWVVGDWVDSIPVAADKAGKDIRA